MIMNAQNPNQDLYIYEEPTFSDVNTCISFVRSEQNALIYTASKAYQGRKIDNIYCAEEKALKKLLQDMRNATGDIAI